MFWQIVYRRKILVFFLQRAFNQIQLAGSIRCFWFCHGHWKNEIKFYQLKKFIRNKEDVTFIRCSRSDYISSSYILVSFLKTWSLVKWVIPKPQTKKFELCWLFTNWEANNMFLLSLEGSDPHSLTNTPSRSITTGLGRHI